MNELIQLTDFCSDKTRVETVYKGHQRYYNWLLDLLDEMQEKRPSRELKIISEETNGRTRFALFGEDLRTPEEKRLENKERIEGGFIT